MATGAGITLTRRRRIRGWPTAATAIVLALVAAAQAQAQVSSAIGLFSPAVSDSDGQSALAPPDAAPFDQPTGSIRDSADDKASANAPGTAAGNTGFNASSPPPELAAPAGGSADSLTTTAPASPGGAALAGAGQQAVAATAIPPLPPPPRPHRRRKRVAGEDPYAPLGLRLGSFVLKPAIEISGGYDSNPGQVSRGPKGNAVVVVAPELQLQSDWSRHQLRVDLRGSYETYPGYQAQPSVNQPYFNGTVDGRIDVNRQTRIDLEGRYLLTTENPNSPDLPAGLAKLPITTTAGATVGATHSFNRLELGVSGRYDRITYADSALTNGASVSNADRDYNQYGVKLRGSYELLAGVKPFVEVEADRRHYDLAVDASGINRNSTGETVSVGSSFELTHLITGSASVGYAMRHYRDPALSDIHGLIANGALAWKATPLTTLTLSAASSIGESTLPGVSGVLERDYGLKLDHAFRRWLIATGAFDYSTLDYVGSVRSDQRYAASAQLTYKLSREVWLKGQYRHEWQTSSVPNAGYTADVVLLGVRLQR